MFYCLMLCGVLIFYKILFVFSVMGRDKVTVNISRGAGVGSTARP